MYTAQLLEHLSSILKVLGSIRRTPQTKEQTNKLSKGGCVWFSPYTLKLKLEIGNFTEMYMQGFLRHPQYPFHETVLFLCSSCESRFNLLLYCFIQGFWKIMFSLCRANLRVAYICPWRMDLAAQGLAGSVPVPFHSRSLGSLAALF